MVVVRARKRPEGAPIGDAEWRSLAEPFREWVWGICRENEALRERIGLNSTNSSKPPSSDQANDVKKRRRQRSGRRPGGQPGHEGHSRALVSEDRVAEFVDCYPERCRCCGRDVRGMRGDGEAPLRHQVAEIPEIVPTVTEYRRHRIGCPDCGTVTVGALPDGVPKGCFGPMLRSLVVTLCGRYRMSRREAVEFCAEALSLDVSLGTVDNQCRGVGASLAAPVDEVRDHIRACEVAHLDETGWKQKGERRWTWVAVTAVAAYFQIAKSRGAAIVSAILGPAFLGFIVSDRWSAYTIIDALRRQVCWAHLKRDFQRFADRGGSARCFGEAGLALTKRLFTIWRSHREKRISRRVMQKRMAEVEVAVGELLGDGLEHEDQKVRGFSKKLLQLEPSLFLFSRVECVEPTNNLAERALRPVVLWRKGSFGTMSDAGSRFVERVMTAVMTCRLQGRSVLTYLRAVCTAQDHGHAIPSLLSQKTRDAPSVRKGRVLSRTG
jgi:transposase